MSHSSSATELVTAEWLPRLNARDVEVLRLLAVGRSTGQIAAALSISSNTARTRIRRVLSKLHVADRSAAVGAAGDLGLLRNRRVPVPVGC
jgi:ATP/maltotriose-dependent transcriptional regulator MalT